MDRVGCAGHVLRHRIAAGGVAAAPTVVGGGARPRPSPSGAAGGVQRCRAGRHAGAGGRPRRAGGRRVVALDGAAVGPHRPGLGGRLGQLAPLVPAGLPVGAAGRAVRVVGLAPATGAGDGRRRGGVRRRGGGALVGHPCLAGRRPAAVRAVHDRRVLASCGGLPYGAAWASAGRRVAGVHGRGCGGPGGGHAAGRGRERRSSAAPADGGRLAGRDRRGRAAVHRVVHAPERGGGARPGEPPQPDDLPVAPAGHRARLLGAGAGGPRCHRAGGVGGAAGAGGGGHARRRRRGWLGGGPRRPPVARTGATPGSRRRGDGRRRRGRGGHARSVRCHRHVAGRRAAEGPVACAGGPGVRRHAGHHGRGHGARCGRAARRRGVGIVGAGGVRAAPPTRAPGRGGGRCRGTGADGGVGGHHGHRRRDGGRVDRRRPVGGRRGQRPLRRP